MIALAPRESELLDFLRTHLAAHGFCPSLMEIGAAVRLKSKGDISRRITILVEKGYLRRHAHSHRNLQLVQTKDHHAADCLCDRCAQARYIAQLKLVQGLQIDPPVSIRLAIATNFKSLSNSTRAAFLGGRSRGVAAAPPRTALPSEGR